MAYKIETTLHDGRVIIHQDVIHTTLTTTFNFTDKLKILFGRKLIQHVEIYTDNEVVTVVGSQTKSHVEPLSPTRSIGMQQKQEDSCYTD